MVERLGYTLLSTLPDIPRSWSTLPLLPTVAPSIVLPQFVPAHPKLLSDLLCFRGHSQSTNLNPHPLHTPLGSMHQKWLSLHHEKGIIFFSLQIFEIVRVVAKSCYNIVHKQRIMGVKRQESLGIHPGCCLELPVHALTIELQLPSQVQASQGLIPSDSCPSIMSLCAI